MKVSRSFDEFSGPKNAVVTVGTFDGVHIGHQKIISRMKELAESIQGETVIITFFPHPRMILHPEDTQLKMLNTIQEKIELLESMGVDHLIITPFTRDFSNMTSDEFTREILVSRVKTRKLVIGYDHRFGKDREGNLVSLRYAGSIYGFDVEEITKQDVDDIAVSSTKIRESLSRGEVEVANKYLRYLYPIHGTVMLGDQLGRTLGYPTANILIPETYKLIPSDGIYAVYVEVKNKVYQGMLYIGKRPVVNGMNRSIEVNLFDFDEDIYNHPISVQLLQFIRPDQNFPGLEELKAQMAEDKKSCLLIFNDRRIQSFS